MSINLQSQKKPAISDNVELTHKLNESKEIQKDIKPLDLKDKWELILSKLELPSTRMLMSQQAELISISNKKLK